MLFLSKGIFPKGIDHIEGISKARKAYKSKLNESNEHRGHPTSAVILQCKASPNTPQRNLENQELNNIKPKFTFNTVPLAYTYS